MRRFLLALTVLFATLPIVRADDTAFPLRHLYPDVHVVGLAAFRHLYETGALVVDARVPFEYETIHVHGARDIPVLFPDFMTRIVALRRKHPHKLIVFYCNGGSCPISYMATRVAQNAGVKNCVDFDAGVLAWAQAYPQDTVLLGKRPANPADLVSPDELARHLLSPGAFTRKVQAPGALVLDIRTADQFDEQLFPLREIRASLNHPSDLAKYVARAKAEHRPLLVFDAVGRQVPLLPYYFKAHGFNDYYFLKGGAAAFEKSAYFAMD